MIYHPIEPFYDNDSKILILGSFPSVKSREQMFFYGHQQNRFWHVISKVYNCELPNTIEEKKVLLKKYKIALWDVIASCEIVGSSDSSIKNVTPNNLETILNNSNIEKIFVNGKTAEKFYNIYLREKIMRDAICLPSTSPANAKWSLEDLIFEWKKILL